MDFSGRNIDGYIGVRMDLAMTLADIDRAQHRRTLVQPKAPITPSVVSACLLTRVCLHRGVPPWSALRQPEAEKFRNLGHLAK
jgi:hypothetical protein